MSLVNPHKPNILHFAEINIRPETTNP